MILRSFVAVFCLCALYKGTERYLVMAELG